MTAAPDLQHQFYDMLMRSQYWSAERMQIHQRSQLTQLLRHARQNVAFYETRLDAVFRPDGEIDWNRWRELPILTRADMRNHREAMQARELPPGHGATRTFASSGSTGTPIVVTQNGLAGMAASAVRYRAWSWFDIDYAKNICEFNGSDPNVGIWPSGDRRGAWGPAWSRGTSDGCHFDLNSFTSNANVLEFLARENISYLAVGPTNARVLALEAMRLGLDIRLDMLLLRGASPNGLVRRDTSRAFGATLLPAYASRESHAMGHQCPTGDHYHLHPETALIEILDADGVPCTEGETGRVVITPFFSTAQPLIRYDQGDLATIGAACQCGRTLPVLQSIDGRIANLFRFPDGRAVYRYLPESVREALGAGLWQVAQTAPLHIEIRYEVDDGQDETIEAGLAAATTAAKALYHPDVAVSLRRVERVPFTRSGKLIEYVCELQDETA